ncbi:MaoC/PaaZ C-terminal domain-containing protein [Croceicoccus sp. F390]|uniref:MaoC/PaaZ C-terminal domain-containing protein n=1 Tax=Croceicoccus esteveae TaxID=3075597 RepID=A0ABU2ZI37_9SPHN|nr:MaoC/PaaZ C-terminal domain-containing protein [Croceicoccus sp. F390]MDT0576265.1 MaoC/PaaZ C-terminal domain-containing protein [Croceicoccus sp. F390]
MTTPLDVEKLLAYKIPETHDEYDPKDVILYAIGVGAGLSCEIDETRFVYEQDLQVLPTMALVLGTPGFWAMAPESGLDWMAILHGEQRLKIHAPLETAGILVGNTTVTDLADKGPGKPALIRAKKEIHTLSGTLVAETSETWFIQGAGGFGGERTLPTEPRAQIPQRDPDYAVVLPTNAAQAAIYRLSGDRNPLHIDPAVAASAGFDRPLMHGLGTMGIVGRALVHAACGGVASALREMNVRFTAPVFPGDSIQTHIWQDGETLYFRAYRNGTEQCVIDNGFARITPPAP